MKAKVIILRILYFAVAIALGAIFCYPLMMLISSSILWLLLMCFPLFLLELILADIILSRFSFDEVTDRFAKTVFGLGMLSVIIGYF